MNAIFHYRSVDNVDKRCEHLRVLRMSLEQFFFYNNDIPVFLITDTDDIKIPGVTNIPLPDNNNINNIIENYKHMSTNPVEFELACLLRWFDIENFLKEIADKCVYIESDILVYDDIKCWFDIAKNYKCTLTGKQIASPMIVNDHTIISEFTNFITNTYNKSNNVLGKMEKIYEKMTYNKTPGGVSDMLFLKWFLSDRSDVLPELDMHEVDNAVFDYHLGHLNAYPKYNWEHVYNEDIYKNIKKISFHNRKPTCKNLLTGNEKIFRSLHFLGSNKKIMHKYTYENFS